MFNKLKEIFNGRKEEKDITKLVETNRFYLGLVNLDDDESFNNMSENDKKDYVAKASEVYNNEVFTKEIKRMLALQALYIASQVENWERLLIGRGTINGIGLFEDRFKQLHSMHLENVKPKGKIEEYGLYSDIKE